jgi:hypothetical protein
MEALLRSFDLNSIADSIRSAPFAWTGALAVALLPAAALLLKPSVPTSGAVTPATTAVARVETSPGAPAARPAPNGGFAEWFSGADNPFLTEEQARDRRLRVSLAKVEDVLRRRPDVRDVTVLATPAADAKGTGAGAVVTIRMQDGVVPVALVDAVGTLVSAAAPGVKPQDVTVIDESTGIRARAVALDEALSQEGRKALATAAERPVPAARPVTAGAAPSAAASGATESSAVGVPWPWITGVVTLLALFAAAWMFAGRGRAANIHAIAPTAEDPIAGTLAMALHRCVAEQGALVTTALVERLDQGASAHEVAQLLLNLEPWAAERVLKGMPPEALHRVEEALRDPAGDAPTTSVRALAEAVLSVRAAA